MSACPTPWKRRYENEQQATWAVGYMSDIRTEQYECPCGVWHLRDLAKRELKDKKYASRRMAAKHANKPSKGRA